MKQLNIPLIHKGINIYIGEAEFNKFMAWTEKCGADKESINHRAAGHAVGSFIWLREPIDINKYMNGLIKLKVERCLTDR